MRVISFDLDGTIAKMDFVDAVWLEEIPKIYAKRYGISLEEAKRTVETEYFKVGPESLEWYDINYWLEKFDLKIDYKEIFNRCRNKLGLYPEVKKALDALEGETLIIISNAALEFIEFEIKELGIEEYFHAIFSAVSHFKKTKKDGEVYKNICNSIGIECGELVHVGDNYEFDYMAARQAGAQAYYLDRRGSQRGEHVVSDLIEFVERIK